MRAPGWALFDLPCAIIERVGGVRNRRRVAWVLRGLLVAGVLGLLLALALRTVPTSARRPWDFETYWYAATAATQGVSPYDTDRLARLAQRPVGMPFIYPPVTLPLLVPLTLLPIERAAQVWFATKVLLLVPLVLLWRRYFLPRASIVLLGGVAIFGFNGACIWDLRSGNVAIIEQLLLWAGIAAFAIERRRLFAGCVLTAALFKLFPIAFLTLLLVPSRRSEPQWKLAGGALALFACLVFVPTLAGFPWARGFLGNVPAERPWGLVNPSALGLIDTLLGDHTTPLTRPPFKALAVWIAYLAALVVLSIPTLGRLWRQRNPRECALAGAILYALLVPRMMVYSYLLVLVPVLVLIAPIASRVGGLPIVAGLVTAQAVLRPILGLSYRGTWSANLSFLILLGFWLVYLSVGGRHAPAPASPPRARRHGPSTRGLTQSPRKQDSFSNR